MDVLSQMQKTGDDDDDEHMDEEQQSLKQIQTILTKLTKRIIDAEMEDFELVRTLINVLRELQKDYICVFNVVNVK